MNYYYPLCNKEFTFENIFASESVSPPSFYKERGFGIDYFFKIPKYHHENAILLYSKPPTFSIDNQDVIKFFLEISEHAIDSNDLISVAETVVAYPRTIYLNKTNFKILFLSEKEKKMTILKSETSLPTKDLVKYSDNFRVISESDVALAPLEVENLANVQIDLSREALEFDRVFNYIKGFVYGVSAGLMTSGSKEEISLKKWLKEIINSFAELKNRRENASGKLDAKAYSNYTSYENQLNGAISKAHEMLLILFPEQNRSEDTLAAFLLKQFPNRLGSILEAKSYLNFNALNDELLGTTNLSKIRSLFNQTSEEKNIGFYFDSLRDQVKYYTTRSIGDRGAKYNDLANDLFKDALFSINKFVEESFIKRSEKKPLNLTGIKFSLSEKKITIDESQFQLTKKAAEEISAITNIVLRNPKKGKGPSSKEIILLIIELVGDSVGKNGKSTQLYQYMSTQVGYYSIEKASSMVMKNFVAFVFNPDSMEKLVAFNESKEIESPWISYAFWCAFNGFANTSRNFVKPIFATNNVSVQMTIDNFLQEFIRLKDVSFDADKSCIVEEPSVLYSTNKNQQNEEQSDRIEIFFDKYISKKYKVQLNDFMAISSSMDEIRFIDFFRTKCKVPKKEAKNIYDSLVDLNTSTSLF